MLTVWEYIEDVAKKHYAGEKFNLINDDRILEYCDRKSEDIKKMLYEKDYCHFMTCTGSIPDEEFLSIIRGEPYFEYIVNELDERRMIRVMYYPHLLRSMVVKKKIFIHGNYYNIVFNVSTGNLVTEDNKNYTFSLMDQYISKQGYVNSKYLCLPVK